MKKLALLLLVFFWSVQAQAYEASVVFTGCNDRQQTVLLKTLEVVDAQLAALAPRLETPELKPYYTAWFGTGEAKVVIESFAKIRTLLNTPSTLEFACEERLCQKHMVGFAERRASSLGVCPEFFKSPLQYGFDSQVGSLVHELSHNAARTLDHAYGQVNARKLAVEEPKKALRNADSYQFFFESLNNEGITYPTEVWSKFNSCQWAYDGKCDQPLVGTGACLPATDSMDCLKAMGRLQGGTQVNSSGPRKPGFGEANPFDTCATALNGVCDEPEQCLSGTDFSDCQQPRPWNKPGR